MPTIYIDSKPYEALAGKNLLETCLGLGIDLPYFCWHPALGSVGACRQCAVKVFKDAQDGTGRLVMSCMEMVKEGMRASVSDKDAVAFRAQVIEWLMTNHPHDCPVCDEGGSCHLQDMTVMTGHDYRRFRYKKRTYENQNLGPFLHHEMNRCIQCYRCVRFYHDYAGGKDLGVFAAHNHVYFGRETSGILESPFSGNLVEVCPTGVFTDKLLKEHYTRKWDLASAPSICQHCSLGCNIFTGERYGRLRQITNRYNSEVNGYFLCDKGRFGYAFVNDVNRVTRPLLRNQTIEAVDEAPLMKTLREMLSGEELIGIGSPRASIESNFSLIQLVGRDNFYQGLPEYPAYLSGKVAELVQSGALYVPSLKEIEASDAVLVLGEDIWNTAPVMALAVRQAVVRTAAAQAGKQSGLPAWHDLAVKEATQEKKGFLANLTVCPSPLDEEAAFSLRRAPDTIARLGFAIAHAIDPSLPSLPDISTAMRSIVNSIAGALRSAQHPVIISGVSCYNEGLIKAACTIAAALHTIGLRAGVAYVLPECNSMGLALLHAPSFDNATARVLSKPGVTAIILEADIYRTVAEKEADAFFDACKHIIVLDSMHNRTTQKAHALLPAAAFAETDGTIINYEARAQQYFQVLAPQQDIRASWKWLGKLKGLRAAAGNGQQVHPDEILQQLEQALPAFKGISRVAPSPDFRVHGQPIPRDPQRYSGRTAILANLTVSEPRPPQDTDSPLAFSMEGYPGIPPPALIPFYWAPGWNSNQSVSKYQQEPGGALRDGDPGVLLSGQAVLRLTGEEKPTAPPLFMDIPEAFEAREDRWLLLPQVHLFGSDELSSYTPGIRRLAPQPYIGLGEADATALGVIEGDDIFVWLEGKACSFPLAIRKGLCPGITLLPMGIPGIPVPQWGSWVKITLSEDAEEIRCPSKIF
ncbi:NADH-quinone oxidoreductase subunit NuoG [Puia dinghuensis]|uniref:NADH-quinone oxidoreductase n=1 Tax=Puia dinghuensis TaxID=1792502 RepID=A0A8J2XT28_9BACT|nr:NADH-quinone oxidoreductase subunit NuoG [Puia dinghuensis]GGB00560.1 NADH-quinone oxidoreductase subunit G [Puia dinghuensis]